MDNIQKSIIFVLVTTGSVVFLMESMGGFSAKEPAPVSQQAALPTKKAPKVIEQAAEEDESEEELTEFGEPLVDADPISDDDESPEEVDRDAPVPNDSSSGSSAKSTATDRIAGPSSSPAGPPVFQGSTIPSPPPAVAVPGGSSTRRVN
jgi:hypothetical protein